MSRSSLCEFTKNLQGDNLNSKSESFTSLKSVFLQLQNNSYETRRHFYESWSYTSSILVFYVSRISSREWKKKFEIWSEKWLETKSSVQDGWKMSFDISLQNNCDNVLRWRKSMRLLLLLLSMLLWILTLGKTKYRRNSRVFIKNSDNIFSLINNRLDCPRTISGQNLLLCRTTVTSTWYELKFLTPCNIFEVRASSYTTFSRTILR